MRDAKRLLELSTMSYEQLTAAIEKKAKSLSEVIALERSRARDGNDYWDGSDPVGGNLRDLDDLRQVLDAYWRREFNEPAENGRSGEQRSSKPEAVIPF